MKRHAIVVAALGTMFALSACMTPSQSEGDRLQRVGEQTVEGLDTTGLGALQ